MTTTLPEIRYGRISKTAMERLFSYRHIPGRQVLKGGITMKKIMCIIVSAIIVLSLNIFVSAQDFTDNYGKPGGAICIDDPVNLWNTSFEPTHSYGNGGAIYFDGNH